jgi:hypothetical protein
MKLAIDTDLNGRQYILEDALDLFDKMEVDPFGDMVRESEVKQISHGDLIQRTLKQSLKDYQTEKAYDAIFGSDSSYRNIQKMMNVKGFLEGEDLKKYLEKQLGKDNVSMTNIDHNELNRLIDGKTIRNLTDDQAEYISDNETRTHAWITGFTPSEDPEYTITVFVEDGGSGSQTAGPILKEIIDYLQKSGSYSKPTLA